MKEEAENPNLDHCSFCEKHEDEVRILISSNGKTVLICDECVDLCTDIIANHA